jgi:hypothetical protein
LRKQNYRYEPRDPVVRQHYQDQPVQHAPVPSQQGQAGAPQHNQGVPKQESKPNQGQGKNHDKGEERGQERKSP